jgi:polyisoprenoid-binding protein YceI
MRFSVPVSQNYFQQSAVCHLSSPQPDLNVSRAGGTPWERHGRSLGGQRPIAHLGYWLSAIGHSRQRRLAGIPAYHARQTCTDLHPYRFRPDSMLRYDRSMNMKVIDAVRLQGWLKEKQAPLLLDVLPEESYGRSHLPGAHRATVYETSFLDQVREIAADQNRSIVVYGAGPESKEASVAADKLLRAGFTNVWEFAGGLEAWREQGLTTEGEPEDQKPEQPVSGSFQIDVEKSIVKWTGSNLGNSHSGTLRFGQGTLELQQGQLQDGRFQIDMKSLACDDIQDAATNQMLIQHLSSDDFFDVMKYPVAKFQVTTVEALPPGTAGSPNYEVTGRLTLRGVTDQVRFPAMVGQPDPETIAGQAHLELDRTRWDIRYGSGKFFAFLGKHLVNDLVHLHLIIVARR